MDELAWLFIVFFGNLVLAFGLMRWRRLINDDSPGWHFSAFCGVVAFGLAVIIRIVADVAGTDHDWIGQTVRVTFWAGLSAVAVTWAAHHLKSVLRSFGRFTRTEKNHLT